MNTQNNTNEFDEFDNQIKGAKMEFEPKSDFVDKVMDAVDNEDDVVNIFTGGASKTKRIYPFLSAAAIVIIIAVGMAVFLNTSDDSKVQASKSVSVTTATTPLTDVTTTVTTISPSDKEKYNAKIDSDLKALDAALTDVSNGFADDAKDTTFTNPDLD